MLQQVGTFFLWLMSHCVRRDTLQAWRLPLQFKPPQAEEAREQHSEGGEAVAKVVGLALAAAVASSEAGSVEGSATTA